MQFRYYKTIFPKLKKLKKVCSAEYAINFLLLKVSLKLHNQIMFHFMLSQQIWFYYIFHAEGNVINFFGLVLMNLPTWSKMLDKGYISANNTPKLYIAFNMAHSCFCQLWGNSRFPQKSFITFTTGRTQDPLDQFSFLL